MSTNLHQCNCNFWISQYFLTPVVMVAILTVIMLIGVMIITVWTVSVWLAGQASINCLALLYNSKDAASFYSGCWNTSTNADLAYSVGPNSHLPNRHDLENFPGSQH